MFFFFPFEMHVLIVMIKNKSQRRWFLQIWFASIRIFLFCKWHFYKQKLQKALSITYYLVSVKWERMKDKNQIHSEQTIGFTKTLGSRSIRVKKWSSPAFAFTSGKILANARFQIVLAFKKLAQSISIFLQSKQPTIRVWSSIHWQLTLMWLEFCDTVRKSVPFPFTSVASSFFFFLTGIS